MRRCSSRNVNQANGDATRRMGTSQRDPIFMAILALLARPLAATAASALGWLSLKVTTVDNDRGDSPGSNSTLLPGTGAHEACLWLPLGHMQGGSHCLSHAVERERARWPQRVLGRGHGLEGREPWRSRVAFYDVALTLVLYSACGVDPFVQ